MPLSVILEFARAKDAADPFAFQFAKQEYLLRSAGGHFESAVLDWNHELFEDLEALRRWGRDPVLLSRLGEFLRQFLTQAGWAEYESQILSAVAGGERVILTVRSAAAELYALPWELTTIRASGQHLGELPQLLLRYEWPATHSAPVLAGNQEPRILFAWSAAGGAVPAAEQLTAVRRGCEQGRLPFDPEKDVLPHCSIGQLRVALESARASESRPIAVLHLLCHGAAAGSTFGLCFDTEEADGGVQVMDATACRQLLSPYASMLRLVVLSACDSGNSGTLGNQLGSVAQALHRAGIAAVVASRYPLSVPGAVQLCETLYSELLGGPAALESVLLSVRARLVEGSPQLDWASLQLYARMADGDDTRPIAFRPFRGLFGFSLEHARYFFGRDQVIADVSARLSVLKSSSRPRFLVVVGGSGSGKSSLVLAGVAQRFRATAPDSHDLAILRPGSDPETALTRAMSQVEPAKPGEFRELLVVIDQLEEIFTQTAEPARRQAFLRKLLELGGRADKAVCILATLRVDFLGRCGEIELAAGGPFLDSLVYDEAHRVFVPQLGPVELRQIIEAPARLVGLTLEEGLAERLLADVGSEPGALPLLQDTLDLLWQNRSGRLLTQAAYDEAGGVTGALSRRADALMGTLTDVEQRTARRLLTRLVSLSEDLELSTRRRVELSQLRPPLSTESSPVSAEAARFDRVLERLLTARLLFCDGVGLARTVEVAHEALIRKWRRLRDWVQADRQMLADFDRLAIWIREWQDEKKLLVGSQVGYVRQLYERYQDDFPREAHKLLLASEARVSARQRARRVTVGLLLIVAIGVFLIGAAGLREAGRVAKSATFERDMLRILLAREAAGDPPRVIEYLREIESAAPLHSSEWLEGATTALRDIAWPDDEPSRTLPFDEKKDSLRYAADCSEVLVTPRSEEPAGAVSAADLAAGTHSQGLILHEEHWFRATLEPSRSAMLRVWRNDRRSRLVLLFGQNAPLLGVAVCPEKHKLATISKGGLLRHWTLGLSQLGLGARALPVEGASWIGFSRDGRWVAVGTLSGLSRVFSTDGQAAPRWVQIDEGWSSLAINHDGTKLASASLVEADVVLRVYDVKSGQPTTAFFLRDKRPIDRLAFSPDDRKLAGVAGFEVRVWSADGNSAPRIFTHGSAPDFAFTQDSRRIISASFADPVRSHDLEGASEPIVLKKAESPGLHPAFGLVRVSEHGARVLFSNETNQGTRRAFQLGRGFLEPSKLPPFYPRTLELSADGVKGIGLSLNAVDSAQIFRLDGSEPAVSVPAPKGFLHFAALSPDGTLAATAHAYGSAWLFNLAQLADARPEALLRHLWMSQAPCSSVIMGPMPGAVSPLSVDNRLRCSRMLNCLFEKGDRGVSGPDGFEICRAQYDSERERPPLWRRFAEIF